MFSQLSIVSSALDPVYSLLKTRECSKSPDDPSGETETARDLSRPRILCVVYCFSKFPRELMVFHVWKG